MPSPLRLQVAHAPLTLVAQGSAPVLSRSRTLSEPRYGLAGTRGAERGLRPAGARTERLTGRAGSEPHVKGVKKDYRVPCVTPSTLHERGHTTPWAPPQG